MKKKFSEMKLFKVNLQELSGYSWSASFPQVQAYMQDNLNIIWPLLYSILVFKGVAVDLQSCIIFSDRLNRLRTATSFWRKLSRAKYSSPQPQGSAPHGGINFFLLVIAHSL